MEEQPAAEPAPHPDAVRPARGTQGDPATGQSCPISSNFVVYNVDLYSEPAPHPDPVRPARGEQGDTATGQSCPISSNFGVYKGRLVKLYNIVLCSVGVTICYSQNLLHFLTQYARPGTNKEIQLRVSHARSAVILYYFSIISRDKVAAALATYTLS